MMLCEIYQAVDDSEKFTDIVCSQRKFLMEKYFPARKIDSFVFKRTWVSRASCIDSDTIFFVGQILCLPSVLGFVLIKIFRSFFIGLLGFSLIFEPFVSSSSKSFYECFALVP
jgi:hypothetical protein